MIRMEKLTVPVLGWDPTSDDKDEVLALAMCGFLIAMYDCTIWNLWTYLPQNLVTIPQNLYDFL